jgi:hypothetical protein
MLRVHAVHFCSLASGPVSGSGQRLPREVMRFDLHCTFFVEIAPGSMVLDFLSKPTLKNKYWSPKATFITFFSSVLSRFS